MPKDDNDDDDDEGGLPRRDLEQVMPIRDQTLGFLRGKQNSTYAIYIFGSSVCLYFLA